jgi:hypothetical protein
MPQLVDAGTMIVIEVDQDYDPRTAVDWLDWPRAEIDAYVKQFERGELTPYIVMIVRVWECPDCDQDHEHVLASLAGCDVETSNADGRYPSAQSVPDEYLRTVVAELYAEIAE